jgi:hypothetical protein
MGTHVNFRELIENRPAFDTTNGAENGSAGFNGWVCETEISGMTESQAPAIPHNAIAKHANSVAIARLSERRCSDFDFRD